MQHDVIVIGAGLSGLMAAGAAARAGARVRLIDKNPLPGRKYAYTSMGKGAPANAAFPLEHFHGREARFVADALAALPLPALCTWFEQHGAPIAPGPRYGLMLAASPDAALAALARGLGGAEYLPETRAAAVSKRDGGFRVTLDDGQHLDCSRLVLCCGGPNLPQLGGELSGLEIAQRLGHRVRQPHPAHVGLTVDAPWTRELAGLWMDVRLSLLSDRALVPVTKGSLLFTQAGLTGQAAFDVSRLVGPALAEGRPLELLVNFFPDQSRDEVEEWLFRTLGGQTRVRAVEALEPILPPQLAATLLARQKVKPGARVDRLEQTHRKGLLEDMLGLRLGVTGTLGMQGAEDFTGGVSVREVDPRTFASRVVPGLYIAGRMLDIDADWGGFAQHFALASGMLAGGHAGRSMDSAPAKG